MISYRPNANMADYAGGPSRVHEREATQGSGLEKYCIVLVYSALLYSA